MHRAGGRAAAGQGSLGDGRRLGHLPVFLGYVGRRLLDGCAVGDVFNSPSADQMLTVTKRIDGGKGVVYIYAAITAATS